MVPEAAALFSPFVFFCASTHHRGVAVRQRSFFPPTFFPDLARRQSTERGSSVRQGKVQTWRKLERRHSDLFQRRCTSALPAACLCCRALTFSCSSLLSKAAQRGLRGQVGMCIMECGNCDCVGFKCFQMPVFWRFAGRNSWLLWLLICWGCERNPRGRIQSEHPCYSFLIFSNGVR